MEETGAIALKLSARKAYDKLAGLEREITKLVNRKASARIVGELKAVLSDAVAMSVEAVHGDLMGTTPKQTKFLVSNWKVSQGRAPALSALASSPPDKLSRSFALPSPVLASDVDGRRVQWIYNQTDYAKRVAAGFNASGAPIRSGGGPMWFMNVGQKFSSGLYFKTALSTAIAGRR